MQAKLHRIFIERSQAHSHNSGATKGLLYAAVANDVLTASKAASYVAVLGSLCRATKVGKPLYWIEVVEATGNFCNTANAVPTTFKPNYVAEITTL